LYPSAEVLMRPRIIVIDGKTYQKVEEMPPEIRARYEDAIRQLDVNGNGISDFVEGILGANAEGTKIASGSVGEFPRRPTSSHSASASAIRRQKPIPVSPTVTPDRTNGWMLVLTGLFIFLIYVAGVAGVWYVLLR
jgi:hypothetical protein